ncbi:STAS domain-containing protein [Pseudomonas sp. SIMBA_077]
MSDAAITLAGESELRLSGIIDYQTGPRLRKEGQALIKKALAKALVVDCSAVTKSSSVGLSLLLCYMRDAQALNKPLSITGLPEDMREIAHVSGLTELLAHH